MRRSKQAVYALAISGLAAAACLVLITILANRDSSGVSKTSGPGTLERDRGSAHVNGPATPASPPGDPPTSGPHRPEPVTRDQVPLSDDQLLEALHLGNVVFAYDGSAAALKKIQDEISGPFDAELAAAGQAVILDPRPGVNGTIALAWRRELRSDDPAQLREFADAWLGQG